MLLNFKETNSKKKKEEIKCVEPFIYFYVAEFLPSFTNIDVNYPDLKEPHRPDFHLIQPNIAIEITRVIDRKDLEQFASWNNHIRRLYAIIREKQIDKPEGKYIITLPIAFRMKRNTEEIIIARIIEGIRSGETAVTISGIIGDIHIQKYSDNGKSFFIKQDGDTKFFYPPAIINANTIKKIEKATNQLGNIYNVNKRILLLINEYFLGEVESYNVAFNSLYDILQNFHNINEVWLQIENDGFQHILLYKR